MFPFLHFLASGPKSPGRIITIAYFPPVYKPFIAALAGPILLLWAGFHKGLEITFLLAGKTGPAWQGPACPGPILLHGFCRLSMALGDFLFRKAYVP